MKEGGASGEDRVILVAAELGTWGAETRRLIQFPKVID